MNEQLLQYLWQFQLYNKKTLTLDTGGDFQVIHPGQYNPKQGDCFTKAKIQIGNTLWRGNVLVNLKISDWLNQRKENDRSYDYVLMHVLWEYDQPEPMIKIPVLSLKSRVAQSQLEKAQHLMNLDRFL